jgi:uncharacterized protein YjdB
MRKHTKIIYLLAIVFLSSYIFNFQNVVKADTNDIGVTYEGHVQNIGWAQGWIQDGQDAGTVGQGLRLEALKIKLTGSSVPSGAHIEYSAHVQDFGWSQGWVQDGQEAGTDGQGKRVEGIKIKLVGMPGYSVQYRVQGQDYGWQDWKYDGQLAGTVGQSKRLETLEVKVVPTVNITSISLNKHSSSLATGKTDSLTADINPTDSTEAITWSSSNPSVATVDDFGNVTGVAVGVATITATTESGISDACTYKVTNNPIAVTKVKLNKATDNILLRTADTLTATITPTNATDTNVSWVSSDPNVATVRNGVVTAVNVGTTTITAVSDDQGQTDSCIVTVSPIPVTSIKVNKTTDNIEIGGVDVLSVVFAPLWATDTNVQWRSSNTNVVTVDNNGVITGINKGSAVVTAISEDGGKTSACNVTVTDPNKVTGITLSAPTPITVGNSVILTPTITPTNATNQTLIWTTSNPAVAAVSNGVVTGLKAGTAVIKVTTLDGGFTASASVTVTNDPHVVTNVNITGGTGLVSTGTSKSETLLVGNSDSSLIATASTPTGAPTNPNILWKSSNPTIAMVSGSGTYGGNGTITGIRAGTAVITAYSQQNNSILDTVTITVASNTIPVTAITLTPSNTLMTASELAIGSTYKLIANIAPSSATNKNVIWHVNDALTHTPSTYVSVDNTGTIAALSEGYAEIYATPADGSSITSPSYYYVHVVPVAVTGITLSTHNISNLMVGNSATLTAVTTPTNATNQGVTWTSSDPSIASVDSNTGVITAKHQGSVNIIATSNDTTNIETDTCMVTVIANPSIAIGGTYVAPTGLTSVTNNSTVNYPVVTGNLVHGGIATLNASVAPTTATNRTIIWSADNTNITFINTGSTTSIEITAASNAAQGSTTTFTAKNSDGITVGTFTITVD